MEAKTVTPRIHTAKILLISDDQIAARTWAYLFSQKGLATELTRSAEEALALWETDSFDLIVIDVQTPALDGIDLCKQLRAVAVNPILFLPFQRDEPHLLQAYEAGVDECIAKPVSPQLFLAKVLAWQRRAWMVPTEALDSIQAADLQLDPARRELVTANGVVIKLTNLEFRLLHLLMNHPGRALDSNLIVERVWGYEGNGEGALLKNLVYRLRRKIEPDPSQPRYIEMVAGEGYAFRRD
jgi:DNA-binding response OmpR family regulator